MQERRHSSVSAHTLSLSKVKDSNDLTNLKGTMGDEFEHPTATHIPHTFSQSQRLSPKAMEKGCKEISPGALTQKPCLVPQESERAGVVLGFTGG